MHRKMHVKDVLGSVVGYIWCNFKSFHQEWALQNEHYSADTSQSILVQYQEAKNRTNQLWSRVYAAQIGVPFWLRKENLC